MSTIVPNASPGPGAPDRSHPERRLRRAAGAVLAAVVAAVAVGVAPAPASAAPATPRTSCGTLGPPLCGVIDQVGDTLTPLSGIFAGLAPALDDLGSLVDELTGALAGTGGLPLDRVVSEVSALLDRIDALVAAAADPLLESLRQSSDLGDLLDRLLRGVEGIVGTLPFGETLATLLAGPLDMVGGLLNGFLGGARAGQLPVDDVLATVDGLLAQVAAALGSVAAALPALDGADPEVGGQLRAVLGPLVGLLEGFGDDLVPLGTGGAALPGAVEVLSAAMAAPVPAAVTPTVPPTSAPPAATAPTATTPSDHTGDTVTRPAAGTRTGAPNEQAADAGEAAHTSRDRAVADDIDEVALSAASASSSGSGGADHTPALVVATLMVLLSAGLLTVVVRRRAPGLS